MTHGVNDEKKLIQIDIRCGCEAVLYMEWPVTYTYASEFLSVAKAWIEAHKTCAGKQVSK